MARRRPLAPPLLLSALALLLSSGMLDARGADPLRHLRWRVVGPVNMSGRVTDVEGVPGDPRIVWVGTAAGGVWKSTDGGTTFAPVFDEPPVQSVGDIALAPSNPDVVYVGTGEGNPRNSVSIGRGLFRSGDGGRSWEPIGLGATRHVTKILVHPTDPDTLWVAALGSVFGSSGQRGVFKSEDGGRTWRRVLHLDERHGCADLALAPGNPKLLFATMWRFERKPWTFVSGSEESGLFRSTDGGETWTKVTRGLPKLVGRLGVEVSRSNPDVVYVIGETNEGTLFRSDDGGLTFRKVSDEKDLVQRGFYYSHVRVDPNDENTVYAVASVLSKSVDGGRTFRRISRSTHVDYHALWIDPEDPRRLWQGQDGGVAVSLDGGEHWDPPRNLPIGQFYQAFCTTGEGPFYRIGGGLQDNGTWIGPARSRDRGGILPDDWSMFSFGDAYWVVQHPDEKDIFLSEWQAGGIVRTDLRSGRQIDVSPQPRRNDGGPVGDLEYRFNWNAPIVASPHDPHTVYFGANVVFRTRDFGDTWEAISPDLTTDDPAKQKSAGGPVWPENTTAEYHCTILSLAESPARAGVIWAGTDDGNVQVTRDGGGHWTNVTPHIDVPAHSPVSHVEPSRFAEGRCYVSFDRHMFDDFGPWLFVTEDFGRTWRRLSDGLPGEGWLWVVREDRLDPNVLYAGTEFGLYVSRDRGLTWRELALANLPSAPVHDIVFQPEFDDLLVATHGRSLFLFDDMRVLREWRDEYAAEDLRLFGCRPAYRHARTFRRYGMGDRIRPGENPPYGALVTYSLGPSFPETEEENRNEGRADGGGSAGSDGEPAAEGEDRLGRVWLEVLDERGEVIRTLRRLPQTSGVHRIAWDLQAEPPARRIGKKDLAADEEEFGGGGGGAEVPPGLYRLRLHADGGVAETEVEVRVDPALGVDAGELVEQYRAVRKLIEWQDALVRRVNALEEALAQADRRRSSWRRRDEPMPADLKNALSEFEKGARGVAYGRLARDPDLPPWGSPPRLLERISSLASNLRGQFAAPTAAQSAELDEVVRLADEALQEADRFLAGAVETLNGVLERHGLAPVRPYVPAAKAAAGGENGGSSRGAAERRSR